MNSIALHALRRLAYWLGVTCAASLCAVLALLLDGHRVASPAGPLRLGWSEAEQALVLQRQPCTLRSASWGGEAVHLDAVRMSVNREGMALRGSLASGALRANWRGQLFHNRLLLDLDLPASPIRDGYALFAASIPELATARIEGRFALRARLELPSRALSIQPQVDGMAVQGLDTDQWASARSVCSRNLTPTQAAALPGPNSLLARAVLAAEDQRFFEHPGFDLVEMEQTLGKARILRLYRDNAPWGATLCGAPAAAHTYFGKRADRLTAEEAAWLAAMLHNPALEARRWAATGQINQARVQWVAAGMRATARPRRAAVRAP